MLDLVPQDCDLMNIRTFMSFLAYKLHLKSFVNLPIAEKAGRCCVPFLPSRDYHKPP